MTATKTDLEIKVDLVNRVHTLCNGYKPVLIDAMRPFVGQKIVKADGSLTAKARAALDAVFTAAPTDCHVYYDASHCSLWVEIKGHENGERYTIYHKGAILIGYVTNQELAELKPDPCGYRTDYTADEVLKARKRIDDLEQKIRAEKSITCYFERI